MKEVTNERIQEFTDKCQEKINKNHKAKEWSGEPTKLVIQWLKKYIRISEIRDGEEESTSVYCFVEISTGNILKPSTYTAPEKQRIRGNIWNDNHDIQEMTAYGCRYWKRV